MKKQTNETLSHLDQAVYLSTFKRFPIALEKGEGARVWDVDGKEYIDALAGIAVCNLGHSHPAVVKAIKEQAKKLMHISNFFVSPGQVELSKKLVELSQLDRVFLTNSGAESVEGAFKIARKYAHSVGRGGTVISMNKAFHGRTLATIATGKDEMQKGFEPIPQGFHRIPLNDLKAFKNAINKEVAAVIIEPIQGEGGIHCAEPSYLKALRDICTQQNIVLIFDEIQCGMGRTGQWFAKDIFDVKPDIMLLAKALGNGFPIGAILSSEKVSQVMAYGDHGTTFGGNPLACSAALATLETIETEDICAQVRTQSEWFRNLLLDTLKTHPGFVEIRGMGFMIGIEFNFETKPLVLSMLDKGIIANATAQNVIRLVPPLVIKKDELVQIAETLSASLNEMERSSKDKT